MKLGISAASLYPLETEKALEFLGSHGIPVTEVFFNSQCELKKGFISSLDRIRKCYSIEVASVHPCGSLAEPYFLFSNYKRRYEEAFDFYKNYYYAAQKLGAKTVVLHGDSLVGHISDEEYCERLMEMNAEAQKYGVCISHENVNKFRAATVESVEKLNKLSKGKLRYTFDIKQAIRAGCGVDAMYDAMRGNVINVHISDHSREDDCLLPLKGVFNYGDFFSRLERDGYKGACLIEVYRRAYNDYDELISCYNNVKMLHKFC